MTTTPPTAAPITGITVTGRGAAGAPPDIARLRLAAEVGGPSVQAAADGAATALAAIRAALLDRAVAAADLQSTGLAVHPEFRDRGPSRYTARFGVTATVRDVEACGSLAEAALDAGGQAARLDGLEFAHADPAEVRARAREAAMVDARRAAEQLARLAGQELGAIEEIVDVGAGGMGGPGVRLMAADAGSLAVDAGEQEVHAAVTVRWSWA